MRLCSLYYLLLTSCSFSSYSLPGCGIISVLPPRNLQRVKVKPLAGKWCILKKRLTKYLIIYIYTHNPNPPHWMVPNIIVPSTPVIYVPRIKRHQIVMTLVSISVSRLIHPSKKQRITHWIWRANFERKYFLLRNKKWLI